MQTDVTPQGTSHDTHPVRDVRSYARILLKYAPLIIGITLVTTLVAAVYSFVADEVYEATVTVRIQRETANLVPMIDSALYAGARDMDYFQTEMKLFKSRRLARAVVAQLEQMRRPFQPEGVADFEQRVTLFMKKIDVRAEPRTQLIHVTVEDKDRLNARDYANLVAATFIRQRIEDQMTTAKHYRDYLQASITNQEQVIKLREDELREFKRRHHYDEQEAEALRKKLTERQEDLAALERKLYGSPQLTEAERYNLKEQISAVTAAIEDLRRQITSNDNIQVEIRLLEQQVQTARAQYQGLLQMAERVNVLTSEFDPRTVSIVDEAVLPLRPARPRKTLNMLLGMMFGLILGVSIAFFAEYLDDTVKSPHDVETILRLPFLGLIPSVTKHMSVAPVENIVESEPKGTVAEAYRAIRTNILFSSDRQIKCIVVTSSGPGEGKTTTAVNMAHVMARAGDRTLLIDGDMRRPRIHKIFGIDGSVKGLSNYLVGNADEREACYRTTVPLLDVMVSGPIPPNPVELLNSPRLLSLITYARDHYDRIIIDTPPAIAVTDPAILSRLADAVILTVHGGRAHRDVVKRAIEVLRNVGGQIIGAILNNVNIFQASYYDYYYYSYYRYAYGYKYGYGSRGRSSTQKKPATVSSDSSTDL
ncbi:MAG: polysaccharide biosynthesis tyrosine autokinase [bacterium]|nr:polysaccharide biosynthesis tyrosine autokinase [bacterium]